LGAISGVGAIGATKLPTHWARPIVDHAVLPAHAAQSPTSTDLLELEELCRITCTEERIISFSAENVSDSIYLSVYFTSGFGCSRSPVGDSFEITSSSSNSQSFSSGDTNFSTTGTASSGGVSIFATVSYPISVCTFPLTNIIPTETIIGTDFTLAP